MDKKRMIIFSSIICSFFFVISIISVDFCTTQYIKYKKLKAENNIGFKENGYYQLTMADTSDGIQNEKNRLQLLRLKEGLILEVYDENIAFPSVPAYGPLCEINPIAVNHTDAVRIIGQEDEYWTRVCIEGLIPTWTIQKDDVAFINTISDDIMYVLKESEVYFTPEEKSQSVYTLERGNAVTVAGEYGDWYYIKINYRRDSNSFYYGWIKKSCLGYYDDFSSNIGLQVNVKESSPYRFDDDGEIKIAEDSYLWGEIIEELENEYLLAIPGATTIYVEKKYVEPFGKGRDWRRFSAEEVLNYIADNYASCKGLSYEYNADRNRYEVSWENPGGGTGGYWEVDAANGNIYSVSGSIIGNVKH